VTTLFRAAGAFDMYIWPRGAEPSVSNVVYSPVGTDVDFMGLHPLYSSLTRIECDPKGGCLFPPPLKFCAYQDANFSVKLALHSLQEAIDALRVDDRKDGRVFASQAYIWDEFSDPFFALMTNAQFMPEAEGWIHHVRCAAGVPENPPAFPLSPNGQCPQGKPANFGELCDNCFGTIGCDGTCMPNGLTTRLQCGSSCTYTREDNQNCGGCGIVCPSQSSCREMIDQVSGLRFGDCVCEGGMQLRNGHCSCPDGQELKDGHCQTPITCAECVCGLWAARRDGQQVCDPSGGPVCFATQIDCIRANGDPDSSQTCSVCNLQ
jgi:hypothetical protein